MNKWKSLTVVLIISSVFFAGKTTQKEIIKLGTLATETSDWGKTFKQMNAELIKKSNANLRLRFFFGRGEKELIDLLKSKQVDAVFVSVPSLAQIIPEIFLLQLPMQFLTYEELDHARNGLSKYFSQQFEKKGYTLLGWGDLGFAYLFSKEPIKTQTDLQNTQLWVWDIDPVGKAFAVAAGPDPVLLPVQSVLSSLINDDIQTVYAPPLACIAYQWHTQVKYMTDFPIGAGVGATIINKSRLNSLPAEQIDLFRDIMKKYHSQLITTIRKRNEESISVLKEQGIEVITVPHREKSKWLQIAQKVRNQFVGQLYDRELLDEINNLLAEYRKNKK